MNIKKEGRILSAVLFLQVAELCVAEDFGKWRYPNKFDLSGDWLTYQKNIPTPFYAKGDFNGDGKPDEAWMMISKDGASWGLFVFLAGRSEPVQLDKEDMKKIKPQSMAIQAISPADFESDCTVRHDPECKTLELKNDAIEYAAYESANSIFYWDRESQKFKRFWRGD